MYYQEAIEYLTELEVFGMKPGLERVAGVLAVLGNPERAYPSVHITGTNGKGSVSAMLASVLKQGGLKTGLFVSPHLEDYTERIQVNGEFIGQSDFAAAIAAVKQAADILTAQGGESPTQFEVLTAAAFWHFAKVKVDYAVIEVGLGGLYDSTNVITPRLSVITNVTLEHADKCGGTLEGVAEHKAGIIKPNTPLVTGASGRPLSIILQKAAAFHAPALIYGRDFRADSRDFDPSGQNILYEFEGAQKNYRLSLLGQHQAVNAALAVTAARILAKGERRIDERAIADGLQKARWPGRFEVVACGEQRIILDGAHNPAGIIALRQALDDYFPASPCLFVLGILRDKNIPAMLKNLLRPNDKVIVTRPDSPRAAAPEELLPQVQNICAASSIGVPQAAMAEALASGEPLVVVCGSLYLVGAIRKKLIDRSTFLALR